MKSNENKPKKLEIVRKGRDLRELENPDLEDVTGGKQQGALGIGCGGPDECLAHHQY